MSSVSLAEDIIMEILSMLPVKSLLRFKCVCKEWYQLIQSPIFISKHFNRETNHSRLLIQYRPPNQPHCHCSHFALFPDKDLNGAPPLHEDLHVQLNIVQTYGPVNGIFLLHIELFNPHQEYRQDRLALWNPATRQFRRILYPKITPPKHFYLGKQVFGFGFDCLSNEYKVIWFRTYWADDQVHSDDEVDWSDEIDAPYDGRCYGTEVIVYSLSKDSWSSPVALGFLYPEDSLCSTYMNGAYYWLGWNEQDNLIISFDMTTDVFRHIKIPINLDGDGELIFYNGFLAILISDFILCDRGDDGRQIQDNIYYYVWVMKEEGCWIKLLTIGPCPNWGLARGVWNNEIMINNHKSGRLLLYNVDSCEAKDLGLQDIPGGSVFFAYTYKESLVSIKGTAEDWEVFVAYED